jgi:hypothetical protein
MGDGRAAGVSPVGGDRASRAIKTMQGEAGAIKNLFSCMFRYTGKPMLGP